MSISATLSASARDRGTRCVRDSLAAHAASSCSGPLDEGVELCFARLEAGHEQTPNQPEHLAGKHEPEKTPLL